ncbi:unnamed protein product, partial [Prorocentrum cordatum]
HLTIAHGYRKAWYAWSRMTQQPLTEQQIIDNNEAITATTEHNGKQGRPVTLCEVPAYKTDSAPLPLLEASPVEPKVYATIQANALRKVAISKPRAANRQIVISIADIPSCPGDVLHVVADATSAATSDLDYVLIGINNQRTVNNSGRFESHETPRKFGTLGKNDLSEKSANIIRECIAIVGDFAAESDIPTIAVHEGSQALALPGARRVADSDDVKECAASHPVFGKVAVIASNRLSDDDFISISEAAEDKRETAIAEAIDSMIVSRWDFRVARRGPSRVIADRRGRCRDLDRQESWQTPRQQLVPEERQGPRYGDPADYS